MNSCFSSLIMKGKLLANLRVLHLESPLPPTELWTHLSRSNILGMNSHDTSWYDLPVVS